MSRSFSEGIRAGVRRFFVPALRTSQRSREDMRAELHAHIEARVEYLVARGRSAEDARAEAERRFGNLDDALALLQSSSVEKENQLSIRERAVSFRQDARFVLRGLARSPAFTAGVVATLALGLGINSAVFRIADRVLLRAPSGVADPWSLRRMGTLIPLTSGPPIENVTLSYPDARTMVDSRAFSGAAMYAAARSLKSVDGRDVAGVYVDSGFFHLLGVNAAFGRLFDPREAEVGAEIPVIVVSYDYWQRELAGVGLSSSTRITLNDRTYQVIGVTPRGFTGLDLDPVDVWMPMGVAALGRAVQNGVQIPWYKTGMLRAIRVVGRVPSGASDERVAAQVAAPLAASDRDTGRRPRSVVLHPIVSRNTTGNDTTGRLLGRLAGVALVVLLIAAANAANLLLARALRRRREIAVRLALGGSRSRIVRLLMVESVTLGLAGGAAAALAGYWTGEALRRLLFPDAKWTTAAFDDRALGFTLAIALAAGLVAGLAPALQLTNPDLVSALKDNRYQPGRRSHKTRAVLVVLQTAFSLALLIASGLLVRSLQKLNAVNLGFDPDGLVTVLAPSGRGRFGGPLAPSVSRGQSPVTADQLAERMRAHPDVRALALASTVPFGATSGMGISIPGRTNDVPSDLNGPYFTAVGPSYFTVMGTRLVRGRLLNASDIEGSDPVAVVNETMARRVWEGDNPIGTCILLGGGPCAQVVGIVEDVRDSRGAATAPLRFYLPLSQRDDSAEAIVIRTSPARAPAVAATLKSMIPATQRPQIEVISDRIAVALRPWRLATLLFTALGAIALLLACVGVYSVMSYIASERIHELGVRIVLGAQAGDIVRLVLMGGLRLVAIGAAIGLVASALSARLLASLLFGVSPTDPVVYSAAVIILALIGVAATLVPALRVMRTDPTVALRAE